MPNLVASFIWATPAFVHLHWRLNALQKRTTAQVSVREKAKDSTEVREA